MVAVDSSGWIELVTDGPKSGKYYAYLKDPTRVLTPAIVVYEVYKKLSRELGEDAADLCLAHMQKTHVVPLDSSIAVKAAQLSIQFRLAMADSLVLATARTAGCEIITSDADFRDIPGAVVL